MTRTYPILIVTAATLALTVVPAHAAKTLSTRAWTRTADAICTTVDRSVKAIPQPRVNPARPRRSDLPAIARYLNRLHPLLVNEITRLAALPDPAHRASTAHRFLANALRSTAALGTSALAAVRGDLAAYRASFKRDSTYGTRASAAAKALGLRVCGQ